MAETEKLTVTSDAPGKSLFLLGNEAIARGAVEGGVQVMAAYPGTPSSEIAETIINMAKQFGIYAEWSVNEKVAFEISFAASICGVRSLSIMKHVGVNVAHDPLATAAYIGARGGLVIISADDPGQWSSQVEQDNRYLAKQCYIPVLEPSSSQEAKDMMADSFRLSEEFGQPFMLRSVTRIGHARGDVRLGTLPKEKKEARFEKNPAAYVTLPANSRRYRRNMIARLAKITAAVDTLPYNQLKIVKGARLGIIASGISYSYALEAVRWLNMEDKVSILKIGTPYPLPEKLTRELLKSVPEVLVVEELEPLVEKDAKAIAQTDGIAVKIHGKDLLPLAGEISTRMVTEAIMKLMGIKAPVDFARIDGLVADVAPLLPLRPPTMCAGCPHRASLYAINVAAKRVTTETGLEPILPGDIGCYSMGASAPLNGDDTSICMGSGFDMANGFAHTVKNHVIGHLGDSTFFHSGIPPMINAVQHKTKMTMVVLDNSATAMTGFQPRPGIATEPGEEAPPIKIDAIARASGVKFVRVIDPFDLKNSINTLEKAMKFHGPSVIVSQRICSLLYQRDMRSKGEKLIPYQVDQTKCVANAMPYCTATCPLHIDVRGYVGLVKDGKYDEALALIKQKLPFPATLGRVCLRPCEGKCKRGEVDESIAINALKRSATTYGRAADDLTIAAERKEKVAIVGGGPAGLMAAYDLRKAGYKVTIFEALPMLGGMMAVGIPEYRLPRDILHNEISLVRKLGVEIKLNTRVGKDIELADLQKNYNAVFLAVGAHRGTGLDVPNSNTDGVVDGIEFLRDVNLGKKIDVKNRVIVVGGGNVAIDCARSCVRLGFKNVTVMYRRSRKEMPAIAEEVKEAENEGVKFKFLAVPTKVLANSGKVTGAECTRMKLGEPDASGRRRPVPVKGSEFNVAADMMIAAIGELPDLSFAGDGVSPAVNKGLLAADPVTLQTSIPGIFAGGDAQSGPAIVIEALAAGRKAAISIDRYIKGEKLDVGREGEGTQISPLKVDTAGVAEQPKVGMATLAVSERRGNQKEVELGYKKEEASKEASRCLSCSCQVCIKSIGCPAIVLNEAKEVVIDTSQCPGCGICAQICPLEAIEKENK